LKKLKNHQETKNQPIDEKSTVNYWENQLKDLNQEYKTTKEEIEKKEKELYEQAFNTLTRFSYFFENTRTNMEDLRTDMELAYLFYSKLKI